MATPTWLTTAQVLEHTDLAVSQQAVKKAAQRYWERCTTAGTTPAFVRKNSAGHWEVRSDWPLFQSWRRRGADRVGRVREQHEREEELARLRALCAEQAQRIEELEAALANLQGGKGTVPIEEPGEGTLPDKNTQADDGESPRGTVPANIFTDDAALLRYWREQGTPSRRAFGEQIGRSKTWVSDHLRQAQQTA